MYRKIIFAIAIFLTTFLQAEIIEIRQIDAIRPYMTENALYFFDIDDTLIDNPTCLGTPQWRSWVKSKIPNYHTNFVLYDGLTLYIAQNAPYKTVEPSTASLIKDLQAQGHLVFAFTARGRSEWGDTTIEGVDRYTQEQLTNVGIDFKNTQIPSELQSLDAAYFYNGIVLSKHIPKGDMLKHLFKDSEYSPSLIIFVDDKLEQVKSVEAAAQELGIPFIGFWYRYSEIERSNFNPMVATIQLEALLLQKEVISDEFAHELAQERQNDSPGAYFKDILEKVNLEQLYPNIP